MPSSQLFLHGVLVGVATVFSLYCLAIEFLKYKQGLQGFLPFAHCTKKRLIRRCLSYAVAVLVLWLFLLGLYVFPLAQKPFMFVIYWWLTFSLALVLFIIPALDLRETLQQFDPKHIDPKAEQPTKRGLLIQMIAPPAAKPTPSEDADDSDPEGNPTVH